MKNCTFSPDTKLSRRNRQNEDIQKPSGGLNIYDKLSKTTHKDKQKNNELKYSKEDFSFKPEINKKSARLANKDTVIERSNHFQQKKLSKI